MRTTYLAVVPVILIGGLLLGAWKLSGFVQGDRDCEVGACPLKIHQSDSGRTLKYMHGARLTVYLDEAQNPNARLACDPGGVLTRLATPAVQPPPPMYAVALDASGEGTCVLANDHFTATIVVAAPAR